MTGRPTGEQSPNRIAGERQLRGEIPTWHAYFMFKANDKPDYGP